MMEPTFLEKYGSIIFLPIFLFAAYIIVKWLVRILTEAISNIFQKYLNNR